jgi:thiol-disulfide isomerase/thioredoxin
MPGTVAQTEERQPIAAPDFTVVDGEGNEVRLSDFVGKPIVLNFWASWCGPCKNEMPHFEEAYKANPDLEFIMVNSNDTVSDAQKLIENNGYTFPVYFDMDNDAAIKYGISAFPTTMLIDRNGAPIGYVTGMLTEEALNQLLEIARTGVVPEEYK